MSPGTGRRRPLAGTAPDEIPADLNLTSTICHPAGLSEAMENASRDWWSQGAQLAIRQLAMAGRGFTADHLLEMCGRPPAPAYVGAVFAAAQRAGVIEAVGCKVGLDGRLVRLWWPRG